MTILINLKEKMLIDSETGDVVRPSCWETLIPYHSYLCGRNHAAMAQNVLRQVFSGERFITKMIDNYQRRDA